jgi:3-oxoadipate enol-lactonase
MNFIQCGGHTIHYKYPGFPADGRITFVFINSLGTDFRIWDGVVEVLKEHGNILLFDNRGHGLSDAVETTNGLSDFADDVIALLKNLSIEKCIVIGLSVGGMIAQILADRIPQKIERLVLCGTSFKIGNRQFWNERINAVKEGGLSSISDLVMQRWFSKKFRKNNAEKVFGYRNMLERTSPFGYIKTVEAIRDADLASVCKEIKIPSLCVVGSEDKSTPPEAVKQLADLIGGSEYKVIDDSAHIPCVDNPEVLSKMIIDFSK